MNRDYAVMDDFLAPGEHLDLWDAFQRASASPAGTFDWNRTYRAVNAPAGVQPRRRTLQDDTASGQPGPPPLRPLSEKLFALMSGAPPISVDAWTGFSQSAWTYLPDAGLEWHSDTGWLAGYIYYAHPAWKSSWGGELLVAGGTPQGASDPRAAVEAVCQTGGVFVYPRPNRLVLLRGGTLHCIKKVEAATGRAVRASVSGFFFNTDAAGASG